MAESQTPQASCEDVSGYVHLTDFSPDDKPWDVHRASTTKVQKLYQQAGFERYVERMEDCSRNLIFALRSGDEKGLCKLKLQNARFCRIRHCPVCQWRRSMMWRARFFKAVPRLLEDYPKARFLFLTLTVKNCELSELKATLTQMNKAWGRLVKRKQFPALGWVKSVEVTRSEDGEAHPHFHAILMVRSSYFKKAYISQKRWTELWQSCLRVDYTPIVNVKTVKPRPGDNPVDAIKVALCETLKYSVKESDLTASADWLEELTKQLHKTRAVAVGGIFKDYLSEEEPEDLIHAGLEDEEGSEGDPILAFGWRETIKKYRFIDSNVILPE